MSRSVQHLVYVSPVDGSDTLAGQGAFERGLTTALARLDEIGDGKVTFVVPWRPKQPVGGTWHTLTRKRSTLGYASYQWRIYRLLRSIGSLDNTAIYMRYMPTMIAPVVFARRHRLPLLIRTGPVLRNVSTYKINPVGLPQGLVEQAVRLESSFVYRHATKILTATPTIGKHLVEQFNLCATKCVVMPNVANLELFKPGDREAARISVGLKRFSRVVTWVGSIYEDQGVQYLVEAAPKVIAAVPGCGFVIVGDGKYVSHLKHRVHELGLDAAFIFTGPVDQPDVPRYLQAADVCVQPMVQRAFELTGGTGIKLMEYLSCGKPVLASRGPGHEFLERQQLGRLFNVEDSSDLAEQLLRLLETASGDTGLQERARRYAEANGSYETMARRLFSLAQESAAEV